MEYLIFLALRYVKSKTFTNKTHDGKKDTTIITKRHNISRDNNTTIKNNQKVTQYSKRVQKRPQIDTQ